MTIAVQKADSIADYGTDWLYVGVPLAIGIVLIAYLIASGEGRHPLARVSASLERLTGLPAYAAGGIGMSILALVVAVVGFYWDVAWHIELGRDELIFTPAHMGILLGLTLIACAGLTSIALATFQRAPTRVRIRSFRIPYGAIPITVLGLGAVTGFPLDEFWHEAYGIDVTMWGPTHLVMISGASLTPLGMLLLYREGTNERRPIRLGRWLPHVMAAALVVGMSTWTGEFDFGVPQFQALYHPVLVMAGSSLALVVARKFLGRGGAVIAACGALILRALIAVVLGVGLGLVIPRFPLYLGSALVVEAAFAVFRRSPPFAAASLTGLAVGTVGLASEWAWASVWGRHAWTMDLVPGVGVIIVAAVVATMLGWAIGDILAGAGAGRSTIGRVPLAAAGFLLIATLAFPLPRNDAHVDAVVTTDRVGDRARVGVVLRPDAAAGADWFEVMSWQGGAVEVHPLRPIGDGRYTIDGTVPVTGPWKTVVRLANSDTIIGAAVYMPEDEQIGASEIPLVPRRETELVRDTEFLMREAKAGPAWPALVAYAAILVIAIVWIAALVRGYSAVSSVEATPRGRRAQRPRHATA